MIYGKCSWLQPDLALQTLFLEDIMRILLTEFRSKRTEICEIWDFHFYSSASDSTNKWTDKRTILSKISDNRNKWQYKIVESYKTHRSTIWILGSIRWIASATLQWKTDLKMHQLFKWSYSLKVSLRSSYKKSTEYCKESEKTAAYAKYTQIKKNCKSV